MIPAKKTPRTAAGRKAIMTLMAKRFATGSLNIPDKVAADPYTVVPDDREHRAGLDGDVEQLGLLVGPAEQGTGEDQVTGTGDRQELREAFDDSENECFDEKRQRVKELHGAA